MARPNPWGSPGGPLPAQFANSFSTGNPRNRNARENVSRTSSLDARKPMDTGFSGFPGKSAAIDGSMLGGAMGGSAVHSFAMHRRGAFHSTFPWLFRQPGEILRLRPMPFPDRRRHFFSGECEQLFHRQTHRSASCRPGISQGGLKVPERFSRIACRQPDGHIPQWLVQSLRTRATHRLIHSMRTVHNGGSEITRQRRDISVDFPD